MLPERYSSMSTSDGHMKAEMTLLADFLLHDFSIVIPATNECMRYQCGLGGHCHQTEPAVKRDATS